MQTLVYAIMGVVLGGAALAVIFSMLRTFLEAVRMRREPSVPVREATPVVPVIAAPGVTVVAVSATVWGVAHLALVAYYAATGSLAGLEVQRSLHAMLAAVYACIASLLTGIGGVLLWRRVVHGRRWIAWGMFLFGLLAFMGAVLALLLPGNEEVSTSLREIAMLLLAAFAAHLLVDAVVGATAQQVGRPPADAEADAKT